MRACERSFACTSIGGAAPDRSRHSAAIEAAVSSHSSAAQHSFWMMPMKPSTWCMCMHMQHAHAWYVHAMYGTCSAHAVHMHMTCTCTCTCSARAVRVQCTCSVHAAAHRWRRSARGDVVLDEESDAHAAEEDPVDMPVDDRLVSVWAWARAWVWAQAWALASGSGFWLWAWAWAPVDDRLLLAWHSKYSHST